MRQKLIQTQSQTTEFGGFWVMVQVVRMARKAVEMFSALPPTATGDEGDDPTAHKAFVDVETMFRLIDEWLPQVFKIVMLQGEEWNKFKLTDDRFPRSKSCYTQGRVYKEAPPLELIESARDAGVALEVCQEFLAQLDRIGIVDSVKDML